MSTRDYRTLHYTMTTRKRTIRQLMIYKILNRKLNTEQSEPHKKNPGVNEICHIVYVLHVIDKCCAYSQTWW